MGTAYTGTAYATIPNPLSIEFFRDWIRQLPLWRAEGENDISNWASVYVQQSALSDTQAAAGNVYSCATTANLQALLVSLASTSTSGLRVRIAANTVWQWASTEEAIDLDRANITLEKWGEGNNPLFHGTATLAELGVASLGSPTGGVYTVTLGATELNSRPVTHLLEDWGSNPRSAASSARMYQWKTSAGNVTAAGQFHYNSGTRVLTLYPKADAPALTAAGFRLVLHTGSTYSGMIQLQNYNAIKVLNIDVIGTGGNGATAGDQNWGIASYAKGTNAHVIRGCMSLYNGVHAIGQYCSTSGGIVTIMECVLGAQKHFDSIPIVFYADAGGQEGIDYGNTVLEWLPNDNHSTVRERSTQAAYSHDGDTTHPATLIIHAFSDYAGGQYGYGSPPYSGNPVNTANPDHATLNKVSDGRCFLVGCRMRGNGSAASGTGYLTRKNSGNAPRILGPQSGHVWVNNWFDSYAFGRTTDTVTVQYFEINTTDYDYRGWAINCIWTINNAAYSGADQMGIIRNNLSSGTEPDRAGVYECQWWNCTLYFNTPSGWSNTGGWDCLSMAVNANFKIVDGVSDSGPFRMSIYNSLIVNDSAANTSEDLVLAVPNADPDGPRYTIPVSGSTLRGGIQRTGFKGCRATNADLGGYRNLGSAYFTANTSCVDLTTTPSPLAYPASNAEWVVSSATALHASANGVVLGYDFYGRERPAAGQNRALGAVEYSGADSLSSGEAQGSAVATSLAIGL